MTAPVGEKEIAAELRDEAKTEDGPDSAAMGHAQRYAHREIDQQERERAGNHGHAEKSERAGGVAYFFGDHEVDSKTRGSDERFEITQADTRVVREVGPQNDGRAGNGHHEAEPEGACRALTKNET